MRNSPVCRMAKPLHGKMTPGATTLSGAHQPFNGTIYANYTSPFAKKGVYRNTGLVYKPLPRHIFRMKVKTACELRFFEIQKDFMANKKFVEPRLLVNYSATDFDHCGSIIPKDEHEIMKMTQYMTTLKTSEDARQAANKLWMNFLFVAQSHNYVGQVEDANLHNVSMYTEEEFTAYCWFFLMWGLAIGTTTIAFWWWWKYGQAPEYMEVK